MLARPPFSPTPWVKGLLAANAVVYLLAITVFTGPWLVDWFGFQPHHALTRPWSAVSYMFLHGGFLHLAFNMLMLFFFGPAVEERLGARRFAALYLVSGLGGALLSLGLLFADRPTVVIGASAAIFGVALAFARFWPDAPIYVFPLPVPVRAKWLVAFLAAVNLLAALSGAENGVAHLAHIGGFVSAYLYLKALDGMSRRMPVTIARTPPPAARSAAARRDTRSSAGVRRDPGRSRTLHDEVDRVLDKISAHGLESLTPSERRLLDEVSRRLRQD